MPKCKVGCRRWFPNDEHYAVSRDAKRASKDVLPCLLPVLAGQLGRIMMGDVMRDTR